MIGFDFLIDEDFRVWLIEVNDNPYLGYANNYAKELVNNMIDHMLELVIQNNQSNTYVPITHN